METEQDLIHKCLLLPCERHFFRLSSSPARKKIYQGGDKFTPPAHMHKVIGTGGKEWADD
ncbi:hypothetical protein DRW41_09560 [Neobacillus piezotolerans]|uniref:Uncharacterized protein n=1 Tax=Neobacillus piezotolerans TaxID=2259171 RepID=A0A3D8GRI5_9BACI|nr:hypothetical protein DRW41_09560 [Neobacillus piezotolerans]